MNINKNRVPTRFGPESRFELRPTPQALFRVAREIELERLKNRLLTEQLAGAAPDWSVPLRRAANEAEALAWATFYPLLVFPVLFDEKIAATVSHAQRQARIYAESSELLAV